MDSLHDIPPQDPCSQIEIPPTPKITVHGVKNMLCPRIMECSEGGFIIVFDGIGLAAKSNFGEVLNCIEEVGVAKLGLHRDDPEIPEGLRGGPSRSQNEHNRGSMLHLRPFTALAALITTIMVALSIKIV